jgi:transketolase
MVIKVNQGHIASALSQWEINISLFYGATSKYIKSKPNYKKRDRFAVSKKHSAMGAYPVLDVISYFQKLS